jgi:hypothetical protein
MDPLDEWVEFAVDGEAPVDVVALTRETLRSRGFVSERVDHALHVDGLGLVLAPRVVGVERVSDGGGFRTTSIVRVTHAALFPTPIFEFQHAAGNDLRESLESGMRGWADLDLPVLTDATRATPEECTAMELQFPANETRGAYVRRILLGPPAHVGMVPATGGKPSAHEHSYCPCCLTTNCFDAFRPLIESDDTFALRLFAARRDDGELLADCRVNGQEFPSGQAALVAYAATWPHHGYEYRKQYVIMQRKPA